MHVAELLSDLTSLQVCDANAALALVSARAGASNQSGAVTNGTRSPEDDPDLLRARNLLELHAKVKVAHRDGVDVALQGAREEVRRILTALQ